LTTGFDTFVRTAKWSEDKGCLEAVLDCTTAGKMAVIAVTAPKSTQMECSASNADVTCRYDGLWEITLVLEQPEVVELKIF
jgi:hypothetical protein